MSLVKCTDCIYFDSDELECHRYPPTNRTIPGSNGEFVYLTIWPKIDNIEKKCGEGQEEED
jgi:hypothetical protein